MQAVQPRPGLFVRANAGKALAPVQVMIERDRIRFFAKVLGYNSPIYHDTRAAQAAGYPDLLAPPSFLMVVEALAEEERRRTEQQSWYDFVGCDMRYLLHGNEAYSYHGQIYAGDALSLETAVSGFEDKKGGALELCRLVVRVSHPCRGLLIEGRRTIIHRLA